MSVTTMSVRTEDDLFDRMNDMNTSGVDPKVVGLDATGTPFMAQLVGAYASEMIIICGTPWDSEVEYSTGIRCDECAAQNHHKPSDLEWRVSLIMYVASNRAPEWDLFMRGAN